METVQAFRDKDIRNIRVLNGGLSTPLKGHSNSSTLYTFDEGDQISIDEGTHGVLVLGGVGRGKTASFMLPMASALLEQGFPGLIIDIKNNFTDQVRKLAQAAGREDDIIEIGTHPTATPINLLAGLSFDEMQQMLESLLISGKEHSKNIDWLHKGVRLICDMAMLLQFVGQNDRRFMPSFVLLDRCINDFDFSRTVFKMYLEKIHDPREYKQQSFVKRVQTSAFHILTDNDHKPNQKYEEQLGYQLYGPRNILGAITADDSLCANLSGVDCPLTLDYQELLANGKIVVLRFKHTQGHAAKLLARTIKERFYSDVYRTLDEGSDRTMPCFFMADEFQDVINVSPDNTFDDFSWFSKAREFRCINVIASQSLSSLYTNSLQRDQVNALVANCSTKIVLQNDDPAADAYFRHFCGLEKTLAQLGAAEALVSRFDLEKREQVVTALHCHQEFKRIQSHLNTTELVQTTTTNIATTTDFLNELDTTLIVYKLPQPIRQRRDYVEIVTTFKEFFEDLAQVEIDYSEHLHNEVLVALHRLRMDYPDKLTIFGIIQISQDSVFLDIQADHDVHEEIEEFVYEFMEGGNEKARSQYQDAT